MVTIITHNAIWINPTKIEIIGNIISADFEGGKCSKVIASNRSRQKLDKYFEEIKQAIRSSKNNNVIVVIHDE